MVYPVEERTFPRLTPLLLLRKYNVGCGRWKGLLSLVLHRNNSILTTLWKILGAWSVTSKYFQIRSLCSTLPFFPPSPIQNVTRLVHGKLHSLARGKLHNLAVPSRRYEENKHDPNSVLVRLSLPSPFWLPKRPSDSTQVSLESLVAVSTVQGNCNLVWTALSTKKLGKNNGSPGWTP